MAFNSYSNTTSASGAGVALLEVISAGYSVSDDIQTRKAGTGTFPTCVACGNRTREFQVTMNDCATAWSSYIATADACSFTVGGTDCAGLPETTTLALGDGCGSTLSWSADGDTVVDITVTYALFGDPSFHA